MVKRTSYFMPPSRFIREPMIAACGLAFNQKIRAATVRSRFGQTIDAVPSGELFVQPDRLGRRERSRRRLAIVDQLVVTKYVIDRRQRLLKVKGSIRIARKKWYGYCGQR